MSSPFESWAGKFQQYFIHGVLSDEDAFSETWVQELGGKPEDRLEWASNLGYLLRPLAVPLLGHTGASLDAPRLIFQIETERLADEIQYSYHRAHPHHDVPVLLHGHSAGGVMAAALVDELRHRGIPVGGLVTYGTPIENLRFYGIGLPSDTPVLAVENPEDEILAIDRIGGVLSSWAHPSPAWRDSLNVEHLRAASPDAIADHVAGNYTESPTIWSQVQQYARRVYAERRTASAGRATSSGTKRAGFEGRASMAGPLNGHGIQVRTEALRDFAREIGTVCAELESLAVQISRLLVAEAGLYVGADLSHAVTASRRLADRLHSVARALEIGASGYEEHEQTCTESLAALTIPRPNGDLLSAYTFPWRTVSGYGMFYNVPSSAGSFSYLTFVPYLASSAKGFLKGLAEGRWDVPHLRSLARGGTKISRREVAVARWLKSALHDGYRKAGKEVLDSRQALLRRWNRIYSKGLGAAEAIDEHGISFKAGGSLAYKQIESKVLFQLAFVGGGAMLVTAGLAGASLAVGTLALGTALYAGGKWGLDRINQRLHLQDWFVHQGGKVDALVGEGWERTAARQARKAWGWRVQEKMTLGAVNDLTLRTLGPPQWDLLWQSWPRAGRQMEVLGPGWVSGGLQRKRIEKR